MVEIQSPFPTAEIPRIWGWLEPFRWRVSDDFSPKTLTEFIAFYRAQSERSTTWAVYRDGELGGVITYEQVSPVVGTAHCTFKKSFWGRTTTMPALQSAIAQMFERCSKLSLQVIDGNKAMLALLKELGASKEGTLIAQTTREGKPVDLVMLALFKDKFGKEAVQ